MKHPLQVVVLILGLVTCLTSCRSSSDDTAPDTGNMTYICLETHEVIELPPQPQVPAVNPATGRCTLVPAYRDPKTNKWRPIKQALPNPR